VTETGKQAEVGFSINCIKQCTRRRISEHIIENLCVTALNGRLGMPSVRRRMLWM
jgi:hypothetical protein